MDSTLAEAKEGQLAPQARAKSGSWALLSADVDKVKEYVFESAKLPEIRGASMLLDELNWGYDEKGEPRHRELAERTIGDVFQDHELPLSRWPDGCLIYARGGSLLAVVPRDQAEQLQREIEELYPNQTGLATITCVWRPIERDELDQGLRGFNAENLQRLREQLAASAHPEDWQRIAAYYTTAGVVNLESRHHFGELVQLNGLALKRTKEMRQWRPFYEALPHAVRCASCQMRPASTEMDEGQFFCHPCDRKRRRPGERLGERRSVKSFWLRRFEEYLGQRPDLVQRYYRNIPHEKWEDGDKRQVAFAAPHDLEAIGRECRSPRPGFVGFFYADGNDIGDLLNGEGRHPEDYMRISQQVHRSLQAAVFEALAEHLRPYAIEEEKWVHPFEILTIGGDDVLLIVPGDVALPISRDICRLFEAKVNDPPLPKHVTLSAGLVIADDHNPVYFLHNLAEELLKNAKRKAKAPGVGRGTIDFLVLKSQHMLETDLAELRQSSAYTAGEKDLLLTCCPYTWEELEPRLWALACDLRDYPRTQLQTMVEALRLGRLSGSLFYLYQWARDKREHQELLGRVGKAWDADPRTDFWPWLRVTRDEEEWIGPDYRSRIRYRTPWLDIVEVLDFVPRT